MFEPQNALNFLQDHLTEININEAKVICKKYNNGDCLIHIARHLGDIDSAISAIENILLDFIEMDNNDFECTSEGDLTRFPQLKNSIQAIDIGVSFLKETHTLKLFRIFTFPLYHSRTKHKNIHQTLTVLYTHFIIQSLKFIEANELLPIVVRHIRTFSNEEASLVMKQILFELEYKKNLSDSVNEMCVNDCIALINKAFEHNSTGIASNATDLYCSSCYQPIEKSTVEFLIFPCGHMFHQQVECCNSDDKCPICFKQGMGTGLAPSDEAPPQKLSKRRIQQLLRRIDFSLKKNYGSYTKMCQPSLCISRNALAVGDEKIVFGEPNMPVKILTPKIESE
ncbi:hypothetical protein GPJ56_002517 [Histomonas meleagridis]|uniref:uncharacterized protein n=1 Tax=Histomonas meleagridis TaxID=135588 RepID=UPI0035594F50|nr:hypothetical protein GPJ56_002517 [Histomonas meleagridis]KAH0806020.1 hypothetical protein GO595_001181 [Histomonas meleagridis]